MAKMLLEQTVEGCPINVWTHKPQGWLY